MKKVILTGAPGFLGNPILDELLSKGQEVHSISKEFIDQKSKYHFHHQLDLFDQPMRKKVLNKVKADTLIHLAWDVEPGKYVHSTTNSKWAEISNDLFHSFYEKGGRRIIGVGTCIEYAPSDKLFCKENSTPLDLTTPYAFAKNKVHNYLESLSKTYGRTYSWIRPFYLFGLYEKKERFVPSLIRKLLKDEKIWSWNGDIMRDYLFTQDLAQNLVRVSDSNFSGAINMGSGNPLSQQKFVEIVAERMGKKHLAIKNPTTTPIKEISSIAADMGKFRNLFGDPKITPLSEALDKTIEWHLK